MANSIWQEILDTRNLFLIHMKVEKAFYAINSHYAEEDLDVMEIMLKTELREEIYALAHEQLGNHAKAKELRDFIAKKGETSCLTF